MVHELMRLRQVADDLARGMNLEIARRQTGEMRVYFLLAEAAGQQAHDFLTEQLALSFFSANEIGRPSENPLTLVIKLPKKRVFEAIPKFVTGRLRIGKRMEREHHEIFLRLDEG